METKPVSFIYIEGDSENYQYNMDRVRSFHMDRTYKNDDTGKCIYYSFEGRTLRIYDTETLTRDNDFSQFSLFVNTIVIEEGTKRIDELAFGEVKPLLYITKMYLPKTLEYLDSDSFYFNQFNGKLMKIYFGGTEEEWDYLNKRTEDGQINYLDGVEIIYNCEGVSSEINNQ